ncbi:MAG: DUF2510 domain-containing protein [Actinomycetes bacterium]
MTEGTNTPGGTEPGGSAGAGGAPPAGAWRPDPTGRHQHRYHDGDGWTDHVADDGVASTDPYEASPPARTVAPGAGPDLSALAPPDPASALDRPGAAPTAGAVGGGPGTGGPWGAPPAASGSPGMSTTAKVLIALGVLALLGVVGIGAFVGGLVVARADGSASGGSPFVVEEEVFPDGFGDADHTGPAISASSSVSGFVDGRPVAHDVFLDVGGTLRVTVTDADFDTVLELHTSDGELLAEDDDGAGAGNLSELVVDVGPGHYVLVVRDWSSLPGGGSYTLDVELP